ncbi:hypothetical protein E2C01_073972 [Portunus trituberculatus]|uniref:Uncharacterized protein n=1 Tax=Portunus trituberculatus TaxID=210409 RepID=A0A5B7IFI2_PORTR|nr:hypothetical protein [Portunus trituberculatus]
MHLLYRLEDMLSLRLFSFLPQRSTHHCLAELYTRLSSTSIMTSSIIFTPSMQLLRPVVLSSRRKKSRMYSTLNHLPQFIKGESIIPWRR